MRPTLFSGRTNRNATEMDWEALLGRPTEQASEALHSINAGKSILITGAGGSIGSALAMSIAQSNPRVLVLLDSSEQNLYRLDRELSISSANTPRVVIIGGVDDAALIDLLFTQHRPDTIYHAAAYKHVPLMESNPFAAVRNNALGTYRLTQAAVRHRVGHFLMVSTDKAVNPCSIMGASKRIAELALLSCSNPFTRMNSIRLGNVLGSQGSVVPLFLEQISRSEALTVTHPEAERFFFTMDETIALILEAAAIPGQKQILVPRFLKPIKTVELANYLLAQSGEVPGNASICFTGLRPGEKLREEFFSSIEHVAGNVGLRLCRVESVAVPEETLQTAMAELDHSIRRQGLEEMLQTVQRLVPEYQPSTLLADNHPAQMVCIHG